MKRAHGFAVALSVAIAILSILLVGDIARLEDDLAVADQVASGGSLVELPTMPSDLQGRGVREVKSVEYNYFDGPVRIDAGRVVFSHFDQSGNLHNIVAMNIEDGSARNLVAGVFDGKFVAEDARYLVYSLPDLKFERSTEITGGYGHNIAVWGDKIVSVDHQIGIYDLDLRKIAVIDLPKSDPDLRVGCGDGPLRISGDKAVVGASCSKLVVVDLPTARIERIIPKASPTHTLSIAEGLIFAFDQGTQAHEVRVIKLSSGRELARIRIDASEFALHGKSLLAMKREGFSTPVRFTLYEVDFDFFFAREGK